MSEQYNFTATDLTTDDMNELNNDDNKDNINYFEVAIKAFNDVILKNSDEDTNSNELIAKAQESARTAVSNFLQTQPNYNEANSIAKINGAVMYATNKYKENTKPTVGGRRRKSRKSRKSRKTRKGKKSRKSRKGRKSRRR